MAAGGQLLVDQQLPQQVLVLRSIPACQQQQQQQPVKKLSLPAEGGVLL
jgi:hypothetical protein